MEQWLLSCLLLDTRVYKYTLTLNHVGLENATTILIRSHASVQIHSTNPENVPENNETPHSRPVMEFTGPAGHSETLRPF